MENTLSIYVQSVNETWELPDDLVLKLEEYKTEHPIAPDNSNSDEIHQQWLAELSAEEQKKVVRHKPEEPTE